MDRKAMAIRQALESAKDPALIAAINAYQQTGVPPSDPRVIALLNQAFATNGVPQLADPGARFATQAGDPNNPNARNSAQQQVSAATQPATAPPAAGPNQAGDPNAPGSDPGSVTQPATPPRVAPPASPQPVTNAKPQTPFGGLAGDPNNQRNLALTNDQDYAFTKMLQMIGIDPGRPGVFGKGIAQTLLPLFQSYLNLQGLQGDGTNAIDNAQNAVSGFAGLVGGGGGLMGQLQGFANKTLGNLPGALGNVGDINMQQKYMDMATALSSAGENPLLRQGMADENQRAKLAFMDAAYNGIGTPDAPNNYISWLQKQQNPEFSDIIRLFGGQR